MIFNKLLSVFDGSTPAPVERREPALDAAENRAKSVARANNQILSSDIDAMSELFNVESSLNYSALSKNASLKISIVYACCRLIAGTFAQMPLFAYSGRRSNVVEDSRVDRINASFNDLFTSAVAWEYIVTSFLLSGDCICFIERDRRGDWPALHPVDIRDVLWSRVGRRLVYTITVDGEQLYFDQDDILHFTGFGFNGTRGMSVIRYGARNAIGAEKAMQEFSADFFASGLRQNVVISKDGKWMEEQKDAIRETFLNKYYGSGGKKGPIVVDKTAKIDVIPVNAKDAQLLESRDFQITDIARAFGLPSFLVNQEQKTTSFGSGIGEIALSFLRFTINPHQVRNEAELNRKLFRSGNVRVSFDAQNIQRGTIKERYDSYKIALGGGGTSGWLSVNEVRQLDGKTALTGAEYDRVYTPYSED